MAICEDCGSKFKSKIPNSHYNTNKHRNALTKKTKGIQPVQKIGKVQNKISPDLNLMTRVEKLEDQMKYLISKISSLEVKIGSQLTIPQSNDLDSLKRKIKSMYRAGETFLIDELLIRDEIEECPWTIVEKALLDLVDREIFDVADGPSKKKLKGSIGRLIKR